MALSLRNISAWSNVQKGLSAVGLGREHFSTLTCRFPRRNGGVITGQVKKSKVTAEIGIRQLFSSTGDNGGSPGTSENHGRDSAGSGGVPSGAEMVVCGGGVVGTSVAYHLAERGVKDVVLLEQGR